MSYDNIPLWIILLSSGIIIALAIEIGQKVGISALKRTKEEKESAVSVTVGAIVSLLAFLLVFTYGIVYERFELKKELVREEANMIRTTWSRSDFLPEQDRIEAKKILIRYVDIRLEVTKNLTVDQIKDLLNESQVIQKKLWNMASVNAWKDMNSDVAALYVEALNDMSNIQATRVAVGLQARIPTGIWLMLIFLTIIGMFCIGYQIGISGANGKFLLKSLLIISFVLIVTQIYSIDIGSKGLVKVPQGPIADLRTWMLKDINAPILNNDTANNAVNK